MLRENEMGASVSSGVRHSDGDPGLPQKVLILGKCHVRSIAACWTALRPGDAVKALTWTNVRKGYGVERLCDVIGQSDIVVSQAGRSGDLSIADPDLEIASSTDEIDRITSLLDRAILFPKWSFGGFHPDMARAYSSAYSLLAFAAFTLGLPKDRVAGLYNAYIYASLGYFDEYAKAERHGIGKGQACGLDLASVVAPNQGSAFMHSPTQPTIAFWWRVTLLLCENAGLRIVDEAEPPADPAAEELRWPVYPEIAKRVGVEGSLRFRLSKGASFVDLDQMIDQSWRMFETLDFDAARATPRVEAIIASLQQAGV